MGFVLCERKITFNLFFYSYFRFASMKPRVFLQPCAILCSVNIHSGDWMNP